MHLVGENHNKTCNVFMLSNGDGSGLKWDAE